VAVGVILISGFVRNANGKERKSGAEQIETGMRGIREHAEAAR
jgi:hypothetical protein